jgi:hypothetical protein
MDTQATIIKRSSRLERRIMARRDMRRRRTAKNERATTVMAAATMIPERELSWATSFDMTV